jgi:ABC-type transport system involved in multi-copper enzyme maturation permease subunit
MWVVWRQQRSIVIAFAVLAVAVSFWMLITGVHEQLLWREFLSASCKGDLGRCQSVQMSIYDNGRFDEVVIAIGEIFAPLFALILGTNAVAYEMEHKTNRLAWTQSGSRVRWLSNKYLTSAASLVVVLVPFCWLFSWWVGATHVAARMTPKVFMISGFLEVACALFCFALAVVIGLYLRRPGWSLAVGIVLSAAIFLGFATQVLPSLASPSVARLQSSQEAHGSSSGFYMLGGPPAGSWTLSNGYAPTSERGVPSASAMNRLTGLMYRCESQRTPSVPETTCAKHLGLSDVQLYIPANQYWSLQTYEGGFYLLAALLLAAFSLFAVRRAEQ